MNKIFQHTMPEFIEILERNGSIDRLYNVLKTDDLGDVVMTALDIMNNTSISVDVSNHFEKRVKSEQKSYEFRSLGNELSCKLMYRAALICYNNALLFAPTNTKSMILALIDRSKLYLRVEAKDACLKDIELCRKLQSSEEIITQLDALKEQCRGINSYDKYSTEEYTFAREFFKFDVIRNKHVPCASEYVDIIKENGLTKIVAAKDIKSGKTVAIEPAFVAVLNNENDYTSCHYCHKLSLNLIPCDGCCQVLFCDETCKKQSLKEYHAVECHIIDVINSVSSTAKCKLSIVAALKIREMSDSWEDFISQSLKIGKSGTEDCSISEIYDEKNKKSTLNFINKGHFVYGKIFNQCFGYAAILKYLTDIPEYLPRDDQNRAEAQAALGRIMLFLYVYFNFPQEIQNSIQNKSTGDISTEPEPSVGFFSFASKLTHSCDPNLSSVGIGNKLALIAVKSIKKGTELTISFLGHWCESSYEEVRVAKLFLDAELRCQCRVCIEDWSAYNEAKLVSLTKKQSRCYRAFATANLSMFSFLINRYTREKFIETCRALEEFQDSGNTREYIDIFRDFRNKLTLFQYLYSQNYSL